MTAEAKITGQEEREAKADALISGKTRDMVLREIADATISPLDAVEAVKALVRRLDRKLAAREGKKDGGEA